MLTYVNHEVTCVVVCVCACKGGRVESKEVEAVARRIVFILLKAFPPPKLHTEENCLHSRGIIALLL